MSCICTCSSYSLLGLENWLSFPRSIQLCLQFGWSILARKWNEKICERDTSPAPNRRESVWQMRPLQVQVQVVQAQHKYGYLQPLEVVVPDIQLTSNVTSNATSNATVLYMELTDTSTLLYRYSSPHASSLSRSHTEVYKYTGPAAWLYVWVCVG